MRFILYLSVVSVVSIATLEVAIRLKFFGSHAFERDKLVTYVEFGEAGLIQTGPHVDIPYELIPNLRGSFMGHPFETNSLGMRDRPREIQHSDRKYRVAVLGDSYTMGQGVAWEQTYPAILERQLSKSEFWNFGVSGYGMREYVAVLKTKVIRTNPDMILLGFCAKNDFLPSYRYVGPYVPKEKKRESVQSFLWFASVRAGYWMRALWRAARRWGRPAPGQSNELTELRQAIEKIQSMAKLSHSKFAVVFLSNRYRKGNYLKRILEPLSIPFVDTAKVFERTQLRDYMVAPFDDHPNAKAHEVFANVIQEQLSFD